MACAAGRVWQLPMALLLALSLSATVVPAFALSHGHVLPSFNCDKIAFYKVRDRAFAVGCSSAARSKYKCFRASAADELPTSKVRFCASCVDSCLVST